MDAVRPEDFPLGSVEWAHARIDSFTAPTAPLQRDRAWVAAATQDEFIAAKAAGELRAWLESEIADVAAGAVKEDRS